MVFHEVLYFVLDILSSFLFQLSLFSFDPHFFAFFLVESLSPHLFLIPFRKQILLKRISGHHLLNIGFLALGLVNHVHEFLKLWGYFDSFKKDGPKVSLYRYLMQAVVVHLELRLHHFVKQVVVVQRRTVFNSAATPSSEFAELGRG